MREKLSGVLDHISYHNEEDDYTVARFLDGGSGDSLTVVGHLAGVREGENLCLAGYWKQHPRFGRQFQIESFEFIHPETLEGVEKYLASGLIRGIGPKTAGRIVKAFGEKILDIIDHSPERLSEVPGLGRKRGEVIRGAWQEQRAIRRALVFLQGYGLGAALSARVFRVYREKTVELVSLNPYRLVEDVPGIGFVTADRIARNLGLEPDSPLRLSSGLIYVMDSEENRGHTCVPKSRLLSAGAKLLEVDTEKLAPVLETLVRNDRLVVRGDRRDGESYVYSRRCHRAEEIVVERIGAIIRSRAGELFEGRDPGWENDLDRFERESGMRLSPEQRSAVTGALRDRIAVITGGPGTGKTTVVAALIDIAERRSIRAVLAAPTGRAAKRMSETAGGRPASTLHRLLGWSFQDGEFLHNRHKPLEGEVFVVDEVSMVDLPLFASFLDALPFGAALILVGDVDQLPSIGPGMVLSDLIKSRTVPVYRLNEVFRQAGRSLIIRNAHRIRQGLPPLDRLPESGEGQSGLEDSSPRQDFFILRQSNPEVLLEQLVRLITKRLRETFGVDPMNGLQVITPMNKGLCGTRTLNKLLQQALNPEGRKASFGARDLRIGDRVMQLRNDYEKDVFNGDIGRIVSFDSEQQVVTVDFDGRPVDYQGLELDDIEIAYAVTVHKSQGSEYPAVIVTMMNEHFVMLQRNLLYTAVSRGKEVVVLAGDPKAFSVAVRNDRVQVRHTLLAEILREKLSSG